jgi:hypothetical protein
MSVIRRLAARNANWVYYDSQFRLRKAVNPTSSLAVVDTELWLLSTSGNNQVFSDSRPCYDYNFKGLCQKQYCSYQHKCLKCTLNHPVCRCRFSKDNQASQNFRPNRQNLWQLPQKPSRTHQGLWDLATTPIKVERLSFWLNDYPDQDITNYLLNGFKNGFKLRYTGPRIHIFLKKLKSAIMYPEIFQEKLNKELMLGHLYGSFKHPPFSNLRINPCGLVPKKSGGWRLITHLSFPPSLSINEFINPGLTSVQYSKFDSVIEMVQGLGKGALLMKKI